MCEKASAKDTITSPHPVSQKVSRMSASHTFYLYNPASVSLMKLCVTVYPTAASKFSLVRSRAVFVLFLIRAASDT